MNLLTKEETLRYVRDVLELPVTELPPLSDPSFPGSAKVAFIESILKAHLERQPFQSISLMALDVPERHRPTWEEIKSNMFSSQGGLCYWQNTFMYVLLSSLGLDVTMSHSTVAGFDRDNHVVVLIHDLLATGDLHLVDVGMGYYIPHLVPLDFDDESPVYTDSILTYKLKRESENNMVVFKARDNDGQSHASSNSTQGDATVANTQNSSQNYEWDLFYVFDPTEKFKNLDEFFPCFDICFTDVTKLPFHTSPRAVHFQNGRLIGIVNSKLVAETETGQLTRTPIMKDASAPTKPTDKESPGTEGKPAKKSGEAIDQAVTHDPELQPLIDAYGKYFPQFPLGDVLLALNNWRLYESNKENPSHVDY